MLGVVPINKIHKGEGDGISYDPNGLEVFRGGRGHFNFYYGLRVYQRQYLLERNAVALQRHLSL